MIIFKSLQMKKVLAFGDSLFLGLQFKNNSRFQYHVESYPGHLACEMHEKLNISMKEDNYDVVILCLGINDLGHGKLPQEVVTSLKSLHDLIPAKIVAMHLHSEYNVFNEMYGDQTGDDVYFCSFFYDLEKGDLAKDEIHLSKQGTQHLSVYLQELIETELY